MNSRALCTAVIHGVTQTLFQRGQLTQLQESGISETDENCPNLLRQYPDIPLDKHIPMTSIRLGSILPGLESKLVPPRNKLHLCQYVWLFV